MTSSRSKRNPMAERFYITTPIYYVNAKPHLGHAYTTIVADVARRFHAMRGLETYFLTGTDEHGDKIVQAAKDNGMTPKAYVDHISRQFEEMWPQLEISNDQFIRTTDIHEHLLTTHFSGDFHVIDPKIARDDCIDYVVVDAYRNGVSPFPDTAWASAHNLITYKKPFMITEYGGAWNGTDEYGLEADLHAGLWSFCMTPAAGTPRAVAGWASL